MSGGLLSQGWHGRFIEADCIASACKFYPLQTRVYENAALNCKTYLYTFPVHTTMLAAVLCKMAGPGTPCRAERVYAPKKHDRRGRFSVASFAYMGVHIGPALPVMLPNP